MTGTTPHRATAEQWAQTEGKSPNSYSGLMWSLARCILELRARIEALEAGATCPHIVSSDEGTSYCELAEQQAAATPQKPAPAGSLVEGVMNVLGHHGDGTSRAVIREMADRIERKQINDYSIVTPDVREVIEWLRREAER